MPASVLPCTNTLLRFIQHINRFLLFGFLVSTVACSPAIPTATPETIRVQYSFASQPWLEKLSGCSGGNALAAELRPVNFQDPQSNELVMRIGQPEALSVPAFKLGTDDLLVIVNRQNPINRLSVEQVSGLFTGRIVNWKAIKGQDAPVAVWIFPPGEDVQQIFEQSLLGGSPVTSTARLANSPDEMSQAIANDVAAVGIITRHWKAGNTTEAFTVAGNLPILAITQTKPQGFLEQILACMQK
jgi:hypothetical protein